MKKIRFVPIILVILLMLMLATAYGLNTSNTSMSDEAKKICGSWAYNHDKETAIAVFREDGTAQYEGKDYTFTCDKQFIELTNKAHETIQLRYALHDEGMYLYSNNTYTFSGTGKPDGLVGEWSCAEKNWTYAFTKEGTFLEDGYFSGYYTVDEKNSTFKLVYTDQFEDTVCYFQVDENNLKVEYPWNMVNMSK